MHCRRLADTLAFHQDNTMTLRNVVPTLLISVVVTAAPAADLDLGAMVQPVPMEAKFADPNFFVWCGAPTKGADGRYHFFLPRN